MKFRTFHRHLSPVVLLIAVSLLSGCGLFKNDGGGDKKSGKKLGFWNRKIAQDEYTLAGGSISAPDEEQKLLDAAQEAAGAPPVVSEVPDRIDMSAPLPVEEPVGSRSPLPADASTSRNRFAEAPTYEAESRVEPAATPPVPRLPSPDTVRGPAVSAPAESPAGVATSLPDPVIPPPRESGGEDEIRLLPEPRFPGGESIIPPGD